MDKIINNRKLLGVLLVIWSALFIHLETMLFGGSWFPKTMMELICDGIGMAVNLTVIYYLLSNKNINNG